jgi:hypothetical protein
LKASHSQLCAALKNDVQAFFSAIHAYSVPTST